jgi:predicted nucleic acid-binding protein
MKRMSERSFLDTNVLIYTDDEASPAKRKTALAIVERCQAKGSGVVSLQVLQEYFTTTTRKLGVNAGIARRKVELFADLHLTVADLDDVLAAIDLHRLHGFSFWDALIVRSALRSGCSILYSEDFQHGRRIDGLRIVNPFR